MEDGRISLEMNDLNVALNPGEYRGFTGYICWYNGLSFVEGYCKKADFNLLKDRFIGNYCNFLYVTDVMDWFGGEWLGGDWNSGIWHDGDWFGGTWHGGSWLNGIWHDGTWIYGEFCNGKFLNGTWQDGVWGSGEFVGGDWKKGSWYGGFWLGGEWKKTIRGKKRRFRQ